MSETADHEPAPASSSIRDRLKNGMSWNVVSALFTQGSVFALNIIVANLLGKEVFGQYSMIYSTLLAFAYIAEVATGYTATKYVAEFRTSNPHRAGRILGLCSLVTLVTGGIATFILFSTSPLLTTAVLKSPDLSLSLAIGSGYILFTVMNGYQIGALAGLESFKTLALANVSLSIIQIGVTVLMVMQWNLNGAVGGFVLSAFFRWAVMHTLVRIEAGKQNIHITYHGVLSEKEIIKRFAIPAALPIFTTMPSIWLANAMLARTSGGYSQLALYSAAANAKTLVIFLPSLLNKVSMSLLNNQKGLGHSDRYRKIYWTNLLATFLMATSAALCLNLLGDIFLAVYGNDFLDGRTVLLIMTISAVLEATTLAVYQIIPAREEMLLSFFVYALPRDILLLVLAYILIPPLGASGLASAYAASWLTTLLIIAVTVKRLGLDLGDT